MSGEATDQQENNEDLNQVVDSVNSDVTKAYELLEQGDQEHSDDQTTDGATDDGAAAQTDGQVDDPKNQQTDQQNADADQAGADKGAGSADASAETADAGADETEDGDQQGQDDAAAAESHNQAPEHWSAEDKTMFGQQSPEAQEFLLRRHQQMEADYTQKTQEHAETLRQYGAISQVMAPFQQSIQKEGIDMAGAISRWAAAEKWLNDDPQSAIKGLADAYGVDLVGLASQGGSSDTTSYTDQSGSNGQDITNHPVIKNLQKDLDTMRQSNVTQAQNDANARIQAFATEKDESGNLKRPYWNEVEQQIATLAAIQRSQGVHPSQIDLHALYESATWANPSTREKLLSSQRQAEADTQKEQERKRAEEKRKKAEKAKRASSTIKPSTDVNAGGGGQDNKNSTLGQDVAAAYDRLEHGDRV